ncbi:hypothetical protein [Accumulibacter sp.]|uniref:hypothetical protein n=1 Tax=Accumulibacter sp. TaxID=2053492 RepID=UPI0035B37D6A
MDLTSPGISSALPCCTTRSSPGCKPLASTGPSPRAASAVVTRCSIIDIAGGMGLPLVARRSTRDEPYCADEVLPTGTAADLTPVVEIDRWRIGDGLPGLLTRQLQQRHFDCFHGRDEARVGWLSPVADRG